MTNLIRFSPATELRRLQNEVDRLFDGYWPTRSNGDEPTTMWSPRVDVTETEDAYHVHLDVPGIPKESIEINYQDGSLTVSGERKASEKSEEESYIRVERTFGRFFRSFSLPKTVQSEHISASYDNGVLSILVPKAEESKPRRIQVS